MKPILFNTEMIRAILEGRKTVTRRDPFQTPPDYDVLKGLYRDSKDRLCAVFQCQKDPTTEAVYARYDRGDILWVREAWGTASDLLGGTHGPVYREDYTDNELRVLREKNYRWHSPIYMPREAARLFLRVTGVRAERLREMVLADVLMEGVQEADTYEDTWDLWHQTWDSTIKPADRPVYGWAANPWVWVISFERVGRPEGEKYTNGT